MQVVDPWGRLAVDTADETQKHRMMDAYPVLVAAHWFAGWDVGSKGGYAYRQTTNFVGFLAIIVATFGLR